MTVSNRFADQHVLLRDLAFRARQVCGATLLASSLFAAFPVHADEPQKPQTTPTAARSTAPVPMPSPTAAVVQAPPTNDPPTNDPTVASPELRRELFRLTVRQIREACPGATTEFILKQLEEQTPLEKLRDAWAAQQAATIEKLKTDCSNNVGDTIARLKAACPGATDAFVMEKLLAGSTIETARADWMKRLTERIGLMESGQKTLASDQVAKIRELCTGATSDFIIEQLAKGSTAEQIKLAWLDQKLEQLSLGGAQTGNVSSTAGLSNRQTPLVTLRSRIIKSDGQGVATVLIDNQKYEIRQGDEVPLVAQGVPTQMRVEELTESHIAIKFTPPGLREMLR